MELEAKQADTAEEVPLANLVPVGSTEAVPRGICPPPAFACVNIVLAWGPNSQLGHVKFTRAMIESTLGYWDTAGGRALCAGGAALGRSSKAVSVQRLESSSGCTVSSGYKEV